MRIFYLTILFFFWLQSSFAGSLDNYHQKVFELGRGKRKYIISSAHINYKDEKGEFKSIDLTLKWDNTLKVWKFDTASYVPKIPEYADGWFEFYNKFEGAKHLIRARPIANHIKGTLVDNEILYKDAFGEGIDLKVKPKWYGLDKIIIINKKPEKLQNLTFDFELELPEGAEIKDRKGNKWDKSKIYKFKDKTISIEKNGKKSFFRNAKVWDSGREKGISKPVDIELYLKDGKVYLRKTITKDILEKAIYPLYTDHPTSYYGYYGDGTIENYDYGSDVDWSTVRNASTGTYAYTYELYAYTGLYYSWDEYGKNIMFYRNFLIFDTSGIGDNEDVVSVTLNIKTENYWIDNFDGYMAMVDAWMDDPSYGVTTSDFGSLDLSGYRIADDKDTSDFSSPYTWYEWEIWDYWVINKYGYTDIAIISSFDADDIEPGYGECGYDWVTFYTADSSDAPYLEIITQVAGANPRTTVIIIN